MNEYRRLFSLLCRRPVGCIDKFPLPAASQRHSRLESLRYDGFKTH